MRACARRGVAWLALAAGVLAAAPAPAAAPRPRVAARPGVATPPRITGSGVAAPRPAAGSGASFPLQIGSYPRQGDVRIPVDVTVWFAFDQPTLKAGIFELADIDPSSPGGLVSLGVPQWSALGDTVFLRPLAPLAFGHLHGMQVNSVLAPDSTDRGDQGVIYFTTGARASLEPVSGEALRRTVSLAPGVPATVSIPVRERNDTSVLFDRASVTFLSAGGTVLDSLVFPVSVPIPRKGTVTLALPVTLPDAVARAAAGGALQVRLAWYGTDESRLAFTYAATLPVQVGPSIAAALVVQSAVLEWPPHGGAISAGDSLVPRAVVTGVGTGAFRGAFHLDGEVVAIEEGYVEAGRPAVIQTRGPIPTRRLGEHRLEFVVEAPDRVAARPVSFVCVPPLAGAGPRPGPLPLPESADGVAAAPAPRRLTASATLLGTAASRFGDVEGSGVAWGFAGARYDLGRGAALEASGSLRLRVDDTRNGSARPEQLRLRLSSARGSLEWSDAAPALSAGAPLFMAAVPRRAAQARVALPGGGEVEGYFALDSRPVSAGGMADGIRSDLYAGRITRAFGASRLTLSAYGGYAHEDPTPGGIETATRGRAVYGGLARARLTGDWTLLADGASVRHRAIAGVETGRTRAAWRGELGGSVAGFRGAFSAFRYQPDLVTALNPYALSDRRGGSADVSRTIFGRYSVFAGFRSEQPDARTGLVPVVRVNRLRAGTSFALNDMSRVTPAIVLVTHRGANTEYNETRIETEFTAAEARGGRTTARIDAAEYKDDLAANARHRLYAGSLVSSIHHSNRSTTTLTLGYEEDVRSDLDRTNRTIQGTFETKWLVAAGQVVIVPWFAASTRDYEALGTKETRLGGRLQVALLRFAGLGENALALTGRLDRHHHQIPVDQKETEGAVELTWGQRFDW